MHVGGRQTHKTHDQNKMMKHSFINYHLDKIFMAYLGPELIRSLKTTPKHLNRTRAWSMEINSSTYFTRHSCTCNTFLFYFKKSKRRSLIELNLCLEEYLKRQQIGREINIEIAVSWNIPVQSRCGYLEVVKSRRHGSYIRHITSCQSIQDLFDVSAKASLISD